ncbi:MAG: PQQ-binding-like beta-propeller repeat protein, partial [Planctomycetia bacterium]|nr:PQQ-binding-like beta-propeller repeat protein [Planctomycetia bacterium]
MSIVVQCPHCETRFNLQSEMNGKSMRCPNLECRQVFTVQAREEKAPPPVMELPPEPQQAPPKPVASKPPKPSASKPAKPPKPVVADAEVVEAKVVEAAVVSPPKVKEVVWKEGTDAPPPKKKSQPVQAEEVLDLPVRRKKSGNRGAMILAGMGIAIVAMVIFGAIYYLRSEGINEEKLAKQAEEEYTTGQYAVSAKTYEKLAADYPSSKNVEKYKFFADLSGMQVVVRSVTNRENYDAAVTRLNSFIAAHKDSSFAKPTTGFGRDVLEAGKKLGEDIAAFAEARLQAFQADRTKSGELKRADDAIVVGRKLIEQLDPFRAADDPPLEKLKEAFNNTEKGVKRERDRTIAIDRAREQLEHPTDAIIQSVEAELAAAGFLDDSEAQSLIAVAKGKLRDLVKYEDDRDNPKQPPTTAASLLFVTPIGKPKLSERTAADPPAAVFLCVARGVLYALDEDTGSLLWATRVGPDVTDPPAVARVELEGGLTDLAVVTSNVGGVPAVSAHDLKKGTIRWYQPLMVPAINPKDPPVPAPAAGQAVVVGTRVFVPVRDALGTVYEFDLTTGARIGRIRLGQPVGPGAVLRPGTGLLYVVADARRIYLIDVGGKDGDGNRVNPSCVQVIATGHLAGTLRVPPLFIGPEGTSPAERWMLLVQSDGPQGMKFRAFAVGEITPPVAGSAVTETPAVPAVAFPVPGWIHFPPVTDGERLAIATDTGQFRIYGINQPGNLDKPIFPLPSLTMPKPADGSPMPGLVIPVAESTYWLVLAGQLQKARLSLVPNKGQEVVLAGKPQPVGVPIQPAQVTTRKDVACLVVRSPNSSSCRAVAIDLRTGEMRWQRQLGLVPAAAPIQQGDNLVLVDEDGGVVVVPMASVTRGQTQSAPDEWMVASPPPNASGLTTVASSAGGKVIYTVTPVTRDKAYYVIRRIVDGKVNNESEVAALDALAGPPAVVSESLLISTRDGFVYRLIPSDGPLKPAKLDPGPSWPVERRAGSVCTITPLSDTGFATNDGGKKLKRWEWPTAVDARWSPAGEWELREPVAGQGIVLPPAEPGGPRRLLVADTSGSVWLFAADRVGPHIRRWKPGGGVIPEGKPSSPFALQNAEMMRIVVSYVADGKAAVAINPDREDPLWTARTAPGDEVNNRIVGSA